MQVVKKQGNIINSFFDDAFEHNRVFSFEMDIEQKCNADCFFCFQGSKELKRQRRMELEDYQKVFRETKTLGGYYIGFSGGEPFCNPSAVDIMEAAQLSGYRVGVITNGHLINDEIIEKLVQLKLSRISFSFHGYKKETYARHFGVSESYYDKVIETIKKLIAQKCHVGIAYTVTKYNIEEFIETKKMFVDMGLRNSDVKFNMLLQGKTDVQSFYPSAEQVAKVVDLDKSYFVEQDEMEDYSLLCSAGRSSFAVNIYGDVYPCSYFNTRVGNVFEESIVDIWNQSHVLKLIRSITEEQYTHCKQCNIKNKCYLCFVDNLNNTDSYLLPNLRRCAGKKEYRKKLEIGG